MHGGAAVAERPIFEAIGWDVGSPAIESLYYQTALYLHAVDVDALASRPGWRGLEAVRKRRFAVISEAVNRPAPRIVAAIEELARQLHPEAFDEKPDPKTSATRKQDKALEEHSCAL